MTVWNYKPIQLEVSESENRELGESFQISDSSVSLVCYTIEQSVASVITSQNARVSLLCDENNPPTTLRAQIQLSRGPLSLLSGFVQTHKGTLNFSVPAGWYVKLDSSGTTGSASNTLSAQCEQILT